MNNKQELLLRKRNAELENALILEAMLEAVRSEAMSMFKSAELHEVVSLVLQKLQEMGIVTVLRTSSPLPFINPLLACKFLGFIFFFKEISTLFPCTVTLAYKGT